MKGGGAYLVTHKIAHGINPCLALGEGLIEREALIKVKGLSEDGSFMKEGGLSRESTVCAPLVQIFMAKCH